jgi:Flp pilus assembly protein TadD
MHWWGESSPDATAWTTSKPTVTARDEQELPPEQAAELWLVLAEQLDKNGREIEAILQYEKARQKDPHLEERVCHRLGVLYDRNGNQARALVEFQKALKAHPKDADLLNDLGYSYYNRGQWQDAERYLRQAVAAVPTHKRAWTNLGMTLAQQGRESDSLEAFGKAVSPAEAHANLGFLLATQGKFDHARLAYRRALELEPNLEVAKTALARLDQVSTEKEPAAQ